MRRSSGRGEQLKEALKNFLDHNFGAAVTVSVGLAYTVIKEFTDSTWIFTKEFLLFVIFVSVFAGTHVFKTSSLYRRWFIKHYQIKSALAGTWIQVRFATHSSGPMDSEFATLRIAVIECTFNIKTGRVSLSGIAFDSGIPISRFLPSTKRNNWAEVCATLANNGISYSASWWSYEDSDVVIKTEPPRYITYPSVGIARDRNGAEGRGYDRMIFDGNDWESGVGHFLHLQSLDVAPPASFSFTRFDAVRKEIEKAISIPMQSHDIAHVDKFNSLLIGLFMAEEDITRHFRDTRIYDMVKYEAKRHHEIYNSFIFQKSDAALDCVHATSLNE